MKTQYIVFGIAAVLLITGGFLLLKSQAATKTETQVEKTAINAEGNAKGNTAVGKDENNAGAHTSNLSTQYVNYAPNVLTKAEQSGGRTVIFFAALAWCPSCQAADKDFKANFSKVPSDVTIVIANYDTENALKQKYNITYQDTFVQVDKNGNAIAQWTSGGQGVQALLDNIKSS